MAVRRKRGGNLWLGEQSEYGTPVTAMTNLIKRRFKFTDLSLTGAGDFLESESVRGLGSRSKGVPNQFWGEGPIECEIFPDDVLYFAKGIFNPKESPVSTDVDAYASGNELFASGSQTAGTDVTLSDTQKKPRWPGKVVITTSTAGEVEWTVVGYKYRGVTGAGIDRKYVSEVITTNGAEAEGETYFNEIISVTPSAAATAGATLKTDTQETKFVFHTDGDQFDGWTAMKSIGDVPELAYDVIPNVSTFSLTGTALRISMDMIASQVLPRRSIGTAGDIEVLKVPDTLVGAEYPLAGNEFLAPYGTILRFDDEIITVRTFSASINHTYEPTPGYKGTRARDRYSASGDRAVDLSAGIYYESGDADDAFKRWEDRYEESVSGTATITTLNYLGSGQRQQIELNMPNVFLSEYPSVPINTRGDIERDLSFTCIPAEGATTANEIEMIVRTANGFTE